MKQEVEDTLEMAVQDYLKEMDDGRVASKVFEEDHLEERSQATVEVDNLLSLFRKAEAAKDRNDEEDENKEELTREIWKKEELRRQEKRRARGKKAGGDKKDEPQYDPALSKTASARVDARMNNALRKALVQRSTLPVDVAAPSIAEGESAASASSGVPVCFHAQSWEPTLPHNFSV